MVLSLICIWESSIRRILNRFMIDREMELVASQNLKIL